MIQFGEHIDSPEKLEANISERYKSIKPVEKMSDDEVTDFWSQEFAKEQSEETLDLYDKLLPEIYNRSEDEMKIDFEIDNKIAELLGEFSFAAWAELTDDERLTIMEKFAQEIGDRLGLEEVPKLEVFDGEKEAYGGFDWENNVISLNREHFSDSVELVDTITHEMRHAYQNMRAEVLDTREDVLFQCNFDNYISPIPLPGGGFLMFMDYYNQYVEVDARAFANIFTEAMR